MFGVIAVLDYGIGNLRSAQKALEHVGADAHLVTDRAAAARADAVVLPGVGAFGACMTALRNSGLDGAVHDAVECAVPFLGVCVGMQMLYEGSEESPEVDGLGLFPGTIRRMTPGDPTLKLPHMQWNVLELRRPSPLLADLGDAPWCYFVHSFAAPDSDSADVVATADYGEAVPAVIQRDNVWATQFHPEKSSKTGLQLLRNFVGQVVAGERHE